MIGLFKKRTRPFTRAARSRVRLAFERLETRDCPAAPIISSFTAIPLATPHRIQVQGTVVDENPSGCQLCLSGAAYGTIYPDSTGHFSAEIDAANLGWLY